MALILGAPGTGFCSVSFHALLFSMAKYVQPLSHVAKERLRMSLTAGHRPWLIIKESFSCELFPRVVIWCLGFCRLVPLASMVLTNHVTQVPSPLIFPVDKVMVLTTGDVWRATHCACFLGGHKVRARCMVAASVIFQG